MDTAIVGGGVSGLSVAAFLGFQNGVHLFEAGSQVGGLIQSTKEGGFVRDLGANGFLDDEAAVHELLERLGLGDQCLRAQGGARYLLKNGRAISLPEKPPGIFRSPLLPFFSRLRLLLEPFKSIRSEEQSVYDYLAHRVGRGATEAFADAVVSGIWAGDVHALSMQAAFPRLVKSVEEHGSFYRALKARQAAGTPSAQLMSLRGGMGQLAEAMAQALGEGLHRNTAILSLSQEGETWALGTSEGEQGARRVVLALTCRNSAKLLEGISPEAASILREIPTAPVAVVHHLFAPADWKAPDGFGLLCPRKEGISTLGVLYSSNIFPDRAPVGHLLFRSILGGATNPTLCERDPQSIQQEALENLQKILPNCPTPLAQHVQIHPEGIPQYTLGHQARIARLHALLAPFPGLYLAGNFLGGVAVKDCIRVAREVAREIRQGGFGGGKH
jgi:oxygen-dependent protoporphyrinogen oxidase